MKYGRRCLKMFISGFHSRDPGSGQFLTTCRGTRISAYSSTWPQVKFWSWPMSYNWTSFDKVRRKKHNSTKIAVERMPNLRALLRWVISLWILNFFKIEAICFGLGFGHVQLKLYTIHRKFEMLTSFDLENIDIGCTTNSSYTRLPTYI